MEIGRKAGEQKGWGLEMLPQSMHFRQDRPAHEGELFWEDHWAPRGGLLPHPGILEPDFHHR